MVEDFSLLGATGSGGEVIFALGGACPLIKDVLLLRAIGLGGEAIFALGGAWTMVRGFCFGVVFRCLMDLGEGGNCLVTGLLALNAAGLRCEGLFLPLAGGVSVHAAGVTVVRERGSVFFGPGGAFACRAVGLGVDLAVLILFFFDFFFLVAFFFVVEFSMYSRLRSSASSM